MLPEHIHQYAQYLLKRFNGPLTLASIKQVTAETGHGKRCPAFIVFSHDIPKKDSLAFAQPDDPLQWTYYNVIVHICLGKDPEGQRLVLAHELCHVVFGTTLLKDEMIPNEFAASILGLSYDDYIKQCKELYDKYGIPYNKNTQP